MALARCYKPCCGKKREQLMPPSSPREGYQEIQPGRFWTDRRLLFETFYLKLYSTSNTRSPQPQKKISTLPHEGVATGSPTRKKQHLHCGCYWPGKAKTERFSNMEKQSWGRTGGRNSTGCPSGSPELAGCEKLNGSILLMFVSS